MSQVALISYSMSTHMHTLSYWPPSPCGLTFLGISTDNPKTQWLNYFELMIHRKKTLIICRFLAKAGSMTQWYLWVIVYSKEEVEINLRFGWKWGELDYLNVSWWGENESQNNKHNHSRFCRLQQSKNSINSLLKIHHIFTCSMATYISTISLIYCLWLTRPPADHC